MGGMVMLSMMMDGILRWCFVAVVLVFIGGVGSGDGGGGGGGGVLVLWLTQF